MLPKGEAKKVVIYLNQDARTRIEPLWSAILQFLHHKHVAGATLLRADAGFARTARFTTLHRNTEAKTARFGLSLSKQRRK